MTAVAPPPNFHTGPRPWGGGGQSGLEQMAEIFIPRTKTTQRYGKPQSAPPTLVPTSSNGARPVPTKKKGTTRGGLGTGGAGNSSTWSHRGELHNPRQAGSSSIPGPTSNGSLNGVHSIPASQHNQNGSTQQPGSAQATSHLLLLPLNGTFEKKSIPLPTFPETLRIGRQTNAKTIPTSTNGYFDSKVLSRQHAEVWADKTTGRVWIRDVKSSNGTFINGGRLSAENQESDPHELRAEDVLELGIDIVGEDNKTIVHHKVAARVEHAGLPIGPGSIESGLSDMDALSGGSIPMNHALPQNSLRGRTGSQSSQNNRGGPVIGNLNGNSAVLRQAPMMVAPITMEMVVKRLNSELLQAKQQANQLYRATETFDQLQQSAIKADQQSHAMKDSSAELDRQHFSSFTAPSASDLALPSELDSSNYSTNGDGPMTSNNLTPPHQLKTVVDQLTKAKKEIETKSARVCELEQALKKERIARQVAEDRAAQLAYASRALRSLSRDLLAKDTKAGRMNIDNVIEGDDSDSETVVGSEEPFSNGVEDSGLSDETVESVAFAAAEAAGRHQRRMEEMFEELQTYKEQMEQYRQRADMAESERESSQRTLAELVQKIRDEKHSSKRGQKEICVQTDVIPAQRYGTQADADHGAVQKNFQDTKGNCTTSSPHRDFLIPVPSTGARNSLVVKRGDVAPYASIVGVMIFGVGLMALLNGWHKGERV